MTQVVTLKPIGSDLEKMVKMEASKVKEKKVVKLRPEAAEFKPKRDLGGGGSEEVKLRPGGCEIVGLET